MLKSGEIYDVMECFERMIGSANLYLPAGFEKEPKELWKQQHYYQSGETNKAFVAYLHGYSLGKAVGIRQGDSCPTC